LRLGESLALLKSSPLARKMLLWSRSETFKNRRRAMKAVVFHDVGDIRLEEVAEPKIVEPTDAIVRLTASAICGTDLHFIRGTFSGMKPDTILGHEGVGIVEELGADVRNLSVGDRVVIGSTIACGACSYCRAGYFSQCDYANPNGPQAGTAFFGGPRRPAPSPACRPNTPAFLTPTWAW
jgi:threonine dehydrogenase-like Zn-dependent dehydrogenase